MLIDIKGPGEVILQNQEFKEVLMKFTDAIEAGELVSDPVNGYGQHIRVDVWVEDWMRPTIEALFVKAGWNVSWKFSDRVMLLI